MINLKFLKLPEKLILSLLEDSLVLFLLCILEPAFNRYFHCWNLVWQETKTENGLQIFTVYTTIEFEKPNNSLPRTRDQAPCNIRIICHIIIIHKTMGFQRKATWTASGTHYRFLCTYNSKCEDMKRILYNFWILVDYFINSQLVIWTSLGLYILVLVFLGNWKLHKPPQKKNNFHTKQDEKMGKPIRLETWIVGSPLYTTQDKKLISKFTNFHPPNIFTSNSLLYLQ